MATGGWCVQVYRRASEGPPRRLLACSMLVRRPPSWNSHVHDCQLQASAEACGNWAGPRLVAPTGCKY
jgi:hypothetical protein